MFSKNQFPLLVAIIVFIFILSILLYISINENSGRLIYGLDDAYIHLSIAKNLAFHGNWGISPDKFSSSSSSILWPVLLSIGFLAFGTGEIMPFVLNVLFLTAALIFASYKIIPGGIKWYYKLIALLILIFATAFPALVFGGMEHSLQTFISLMFVYYASTILTLNADTALSPKINIIFLFTAFFLPLVRYEGLFLIAVVFVLLLLRRRFSFSFLLLIVSLLPVILFGVLSLSNDANFLPNSILLKGAMARFSTPKEVYKWIYELFYTTGFNSFHTGYLFSFMIISSACLWFHYVSRKMNNSLFWFGIIIMLTTILHIKLADVGYFFRYDAYLVFLFLVFIISSIIKMRSIIEIKIRSFGKAWQKIAFGLIIVLLLAPIIARGAIALKQATEASNDRFKEHITTVNFINKYYNNTAVVLNDIGAASFYSQARVLDAYGLCSNEPIEFRKNTGYTKKDLYGWAQKSDAKIAILQTEWNEISKRIPNEWIKVTEWQLPRNVIFGDTKIGIYSVDSSEKNILIKNLNEFSPLVPKGIRQKKFY